MIQRIRRYRPRFALWIVCFVVLCAAVGHVSSQQLGNLLFKVTVVVGAIPISYVADRTLLARLLPYDRGEIVVAARMVARALIFVGTMLGLGVTL